VSKPFHGLEGREVPAKLRMAFSLPHHLDLGNE
jgi:hypothetical protein